MRIEGSQTSQLISIVVADAKDYCWTVFSYLNGSIYLFIANSCNQIAYVIYEIPMQLIFNGNSESKLYV